MAKPMMSDCKKLTDCSKYIRTWINLQSAVKEESLTDWLLFNISQKIKRITYKAFSRFEEATKTGADWEWWFLFPSFNVRTRIQAKKIDPSKDNYPSIAYTNRHGLQIDKLLSDAERTNSIPLYAFYTNVQERLNCEKARGKHEGVFLAGGKQVYSDFIVNGKKEVRPNSILKKCIPLSCLLCCPLNEDREKGFIEFLIFYYSHEVGIDAEQSLAESQWELRGIYSQVPNYISNFIQYKESGLPEWWESEFQYDIEGINALMIYDARHYE